MKKIIGNWKCNLTLSEVVDYFDFINMYQYDTTKIHIGIAVPMIWLFLSKSSTSNIRIYAQDIDYVPFGSYTSKNSYKHLLNVNVNHVIIGHSESREFTNNSDEEINKKIITCVNNGINVVLCIGETMKDYEEHNVVNALFKQLDSNLSGINPNRLNRLTIAYEPIWAIGSNKTPTPLEVYDVIENIKNYFKHNYDFDISVLYGGSINISNVSNFASIQNLDGFLIGSASMVPDTFVKLIGATGWNVN